ncbi:MAG: hypothetical protein HUU55_00880 [Myxococcales bacterium]|nr:hypothetical protein [Myxococcales bacterium]
MAGLWSSSVFLLLPSGVVILLGAWFVADPDGAWHRDWSYFHHQAHVAIEAVWGGRPPDLNPWHCAGTDMTENPQGFTSSPLFILPLLFGPALGMRLAVLVMLAVGGAGMAWALGRQGLGKPAAMVGGLLWALTPFFSVHLSEGHVPFAGFALLPLGLALARYAEEGTDGRQWFLRTWGLGAVMGAQLTFGGVYAVSFAALLLTLDGVWRTLRTRSSRPVATVMLAGTGAALFGLPQLLPSADLMLRFPRRPVHTDRLDLSLWFDSLFSRHVGTERISGHPFDWPEYVIHPGVITLILAGFGVWVSSRRRNVRSALPTALLVVLGGWAMLGDVSFGLDGLRRALPVIGDLRVPSRFGIFLVCGLCVLAAVAVDRALAGGGRLKCLGVILAVVAVVELWTLDIAWLRAAPTGREVVSGATEVPLTAGMLLDAPNRIALAPELRHVISNCYEPGPHFVPIAILKKEPTPFLLPDVGSGVPEVVGFVPGRMEFWAADPFSVVIAQSYHERWQSEGATVSPAPGGLMRIGSDGGFVTLTYSNPQRWWGLGGALGAAVLWLAVYVSRKRMLSTTT